MNFLKLWPFRKKNKTEAPTTEVALSNLKKALCVGINDYPGSANDLQGCVNDAKDWAGILRSVFGFKEVSLLTNSQATVRNVKEKLTALVSNSKSGDILAFTYSGHGTTVADTSNDEQDGRDEALCCYDGLVTDDELRGILSKLPKGVSLSIISDSCHSGTITRSFLLNEKNLKKPGRKAPKPKFMPPSDIGARSVTNAPVKKMLSQEAMVETLLTGCKSTEYSYDAYMNGKYSGAMTANAIKIIMTNPKMTWSQFYTKLRIALPSKKYPQTPQLEGNKQNLEKNLFS